MTIKVIDLGSGLSWYKIPFRWVPLNDQSLMQSKKAFLKVMSIDLDSWQACIYLDRIKEGWPTRDSAAPEESC